MNNHISALSLKRKLSKQNSMRHNGTNDFKQKLFTSALRGHIRNQNVGFFCKESSDFSEQFPLDMDHAPV